MEMKKQKFFDNKPQSYEGAGTPQPANPKRLLKHNTAHMSNVSG